jgi:hypothetical protein
MLEQGEALRTWRIRHLNFEAAQAATQIKEHRKKYLDYEGDVSGGRGRVQISDTGTYEIDAWGEKLIQVSLSGRQLRLRLRLELRKGEEWTAVDAASYLRRLLSHHLRNAELDAAPSGELEPLREALAGEERRLIDFVGRYGRAEAVDWARIEIDKAVRERLEREWARWRHPWLEQARGFVDRLEGLSGAIRDSRPVVQAKS